MSALTNTFMQNPLQFTGQRPINSYDIVGNDPTIPQFFNMDATTHGNMVMLRRAANSPLRAFYLPLAGSDANAARITIPKTNPDRNFVFTGALTGCSVVVTDTGNTWTVFHDRRVNAAPGTTYNGSRVAASFQWRDYGSTNNTGGVPSATAYLMFNTTTRQWVLVGQRQRTTPTADGRE